MIIIDYKKKYHKTIYKKIIGACVQALKKGKVVAYPTDTSYGLAVDATNLSAIKRLYKIKGREFNKPVHIIPPNIGQAKKIVRWDGRANKLVNKFWPGPLTLVLGLRTKGLSFRQLSARSGFLGVRMPKNQIALDLAKYLGRPITTTSANISGQKDAYSGKDVLGQFKKQKLSPDILINAGGLPKRKPSTVVKLNDSWEILRSGPVTMGQIAAAI